MGPELDEDRPALDVVCDELAAFGVLEWLCQPDAKAAIAGIGFRSRRYRRLDRAYLGPPGLVKDR